jgi:predicted Zn-ribbon and HTH transcriptional regulator
MKAGEKALVLLYQQAKPVSINTLCEWASYGNASRWRSVVIKELQKRAYVYVESGEVILLHPGEAEAQRLIMAAGGL